MRSSTNQKGSDAHVLVCIARQSSVGIQPDSMVGSSPPNVCTSAIELGSSAFYGTEMQIYSKNAEKKKKKRKTVT
jgi:hypothetical protein